MAGGFWPAGEVQPFALQDSSKVNLLEKLSESLFSKSARARNKPLLDAAMAVSALVATADGGISFAKRHTVDEVLAGEAT